MRWWETSEIQTIMLLGAFASIIGAIAVIVTLVRYFRKNRKWSVRRIGMLCLFILFISLAALYFAKHGIPTVSLLTVMSIVVGMSLILLIWSGIIIGHLKRRLQELRDYGKTTLNVEYQYVDVVLFGPRESGKTSISRLWASPWTQISPIEFSHNWHAYEVNIYESKPETRRDELFDVERPHISILRARIRDYPGEDEYRIDALRKLRELKRAVVLFIFRVEFNNNQIQGVQENAEYFRDGFVHEVNRHIPSITDSIAKAIIVFNKVDLLPIEWSDEAVLQRLKEANATAIRNIEQCFSEVLEYHLTSALTNKGIIDLLRRVGEAAFPEESREEYASRRLRQRGQETT